LLNSNETTNEHIVMCRRVGRLLVLEEVSVFYHDHQGVQTLVIFRKHSQLKLVVTFLTRYGMDTLTSTSIFTCRTKYERYFQPMKAFSGLQVHSKCLRPRLCSLTQLGSLQRVSKDER